MDHRPEGRAIDAHNFWANIQTSVSDHDEADSNTPSCFLEPSLTCGQDTKELLILRPLVDSTKAKATGILQTKPQDRLNCFTASIVELSFRSAIKMVLPNKNLCA